MIVGRFLRMATSLWVSRSTSACSGRADAMTDRIAGATMRLLERESHELVALLQAAPMERLQAACLVACESAVDDAEVVHSIVFDLLARLRRGDGVSPEETAALANLVDELEDAYFRQHEAAEQGESAISGYERLFCRARAVAALMHAFDADVLQGAAKSIYEASFAVDSREELFAHLQRRLG